MTDAKQFDIFILGGGPAGLSAAIYAARTNMKTGLMERMVFGGQISATEHVENYPGFAEPISGGALSEAMRAQAERFGTEFLYAEARGITVNDDGTKTIETSEGTIVTKALIVATGSRPRTLEIPGEQDWWGRGISTCATCDGAFFRDKEVIVIGGGDAAVEEGSYLTNFASKVTIVHRRDELRATPVLQKRAFNNDKIEFVWDTIPTEYIAEDGKLAGIKTKNKKTGEEGELRAPGVFIFIGHLPNTDLLKGLVDLDDHGYALAQPNTKTDVPGLFVAGDLRKGAYMQAITAASDGCMAAINSQHYIAELADREAEAAEAAS